MSSRPPPLLQDLGRKPLGAMSALHVIEDTAACISHGNNTALGYGLRGGGSMGRVSMEEMEFCLLSPLSPSSVPFSVHSRLLKAKKILHSISAPKSQVYVYMHYAGVFVKDGALKAETTEGKRAFSLHSPAFVLSVSLLLLPAPTPDAWPFSLRLSLHLSLFALLSGSTAGWLPATA